MKNVFSNLIGKIFGKDDDEPVAKKKAATKKSATATRKPNFAKLEVKDTAGLNPEVAAAKAAEEARKKAQEKLAAKASNNKVDVTAILDQRAKARAREGIDWRRSIVDLMKICGMDSSYTNRVSLAKELGYPGEISKSKSAAMNIWLHKEMMRQIVANGGKVPQNMLD